MAVHTERVGNLYVTAVNEAKAKTYKMTVGSEDTHASETIEQVLIAKIKAGEIKVGINTFKTLNSGKILIKTNSKEEIESMGKDIEARMT